MVIAGDIKVKLCDIELLTHSDSPLDRVGGQGEGDGIDVVVGSRPSSSSRRISCPASRRPAPPCRPRALGSNTSCFDRARKK